MTFPIEVKTKHFDTLMIESVRYCLESVRYCLGRMTYAVSECSQIVRQYWQHIGKNAKQVIRRDIAEKIEEHNRWITTDTGRQSLENGISVLGAESHAFIWIELLNWIDAEFKNDH